MWPPLLLATEAFYCHGTQSRQVMLPLSLSGKQDGRLSRVGNGNFTRRPGPCHSGIAAIMNENFKIFVYLNIYGGN